MTIYVNENYEIKAVDETTDTSLTALPLVDDSTFNGWSTAKICCYKVGVTPVDDKYQITMITPYIFTNVIPKIEDIYTNMNTESARTADIENALLEISEALFGGTAE